jgi:RNA polymerase sigma-70 factor (ECF subfamily)
MRGGLDTQEGAVVPLAAAARPRSTNAPLALAEIYRRHVGDIGRWAARLGGPRIDVDDVVQEVFIVINRQLSGFRGEARLTTWLFRITERVVRNHRRWWAVRRILTRLTPRHDELLAAHDADALELLERQASIAEAYRVLDRLPEKYRRILILSELEEMKPEDIATLLEARIETVRVWLHRARRMFLDRLDDSDPHDGEERQEP